MSFDPAGGYAPSKTQHLQDEWLIGMAHYQLADHPRRRAQIRRILSCDNHPDLVKDPELYAANQMTPSAEEAELLGVRTWRISKRLVDLRYSASFTTGHRGKRQELLLTTLPPSRVPTNARFRSLTST